MKITAAVVELKCGKIVTVAQVATAIQEHSRAINIRIETIVERVAKQELTVALNQDSLILVPARLTEYLIRSHA